MHIFIRKLTSAFQLPVHNWVILTKSWFILLYVRLRMDLTPFRNWKHWLEEHHVEAQRPLTESEKSSIVIHRRMVTLASRYHFVNANCLPKSLTLKWMLQKENIHCELRLGLRQGAEQFQGHAWLQRNDIVLNDDHDVALRYPVKQKITQNSINL